MSHSNASGTDTVGDAVLIDPTVDGNGFGFGSQRTIVVAAAADLYQVVDDDSSRSVGSGAPARHHAASARPAPAARHGTTSVASAFRKAAPMAPSSASFTVS